jgi:threonine dehydratase
VVIHPYDDPLVVAGQGTVALELLEDHPDLDALLVPTGGGGLLTGMAVAARALRPGMEIVGVQSDRWPALADALSGERHPLGEPTIAEGIAVPAPGELTVALARALVDDIVTVDEESLEGAVNLLLEIEKVVLEGAGGAGIAALLQHRDLLRDRRIGVVLTGGNVDPRLLASVIMRGLVRSGRLTRLQIQIPDQPGVLGRVATVVGQAGANIVEIVHDRMFLDVPARSAELEVVMETFDHAHVDRVIEALAEAGFTARVAGVTFGPR